MIERNGDSLVIFCDHCSEEEPASTNDWNEAMAEWKEKGWRTYKEKGEWENKCPTCMEKWKQ